MKKLTLLVLVASVFVCLTPAAHAQRRGGLIRRLFNRTPPEVEEPEKDEEPKKEKNAPKKEAKPPANESTGKSPTLAPRQAKSAEAAGSENAEIAGNIFGMDLRQSEAGQVSVLGVDRKSEGQVAGIKKGDRIVSIAGVDVTSLDEIQGITEVLGNGDRIEVKLKRDGEEIVRNVAVTTSGKAERQNAEDTDSEMSSSLAIARRPEPAARNDTRGTESILDLASDEDRAETVVADAIEENEFDAILEPLKFAESEPVSDRKLAEDANAFVRSREARPGAPQPSDESLARKALKEKLDEPRPRLMKELVQAIESRDTSVLIQTVLRQQALLESQAAEIERLKQQLTTRPQRSRF